MKRIFTGFFDNWDSVSRFGDVDFRQWIGKYKKLRKYLEMHEDTETLIDEKEFRFLDSIIKKRERFLGGNGANAAVALSEAGIKPVMSCPARTEYILSELSLKGILMAEGDIIVPPEKASLNNKEYEHISIENEGYRHIFTYDPIAFEMDIDYNFISALKMADLLWISGFHLANRSAKSRIDEIADDLEDRIFLTHLEVGNGTDMMEYAIARLTAKHAINSIGFNYSELSYFGIMPEEVLLEDGLRMISERYGIENVMLHTPDFVAVYSEKADDNMIKYIKNAIGLSAAKSFGIISRKTIKLAEELKVSDIKSVKSRNFFLLPTKINHSPLKKTGLGDAFSALAFYYSSIGRL